MRPRCCRLNRNGPIAPVSGAGGYPGAPYFRITIANTERSLTATAGGELSATSFTGAPEQLWRIDQLTDGSYRIGPKAIPGTNESLVLVRGRQQHAHARQVRSDERSATLVSGGAVMKRALATCSSWAARHWPARHSAEAGLDPTCRNVSQSAQGRDASPSMRAGSSHRWLVLEPVPVPGRLTESAVEEAVQSAPLPREGDAP